MYHTYVIRSLARGQRYVGSCRDLDDRLHRHNAGESLATKHGLPWKLVYYEQWPTRAEAVRRERYFKTGRGREELDKLGL